MIPRALATIRPFVATTLGHRATIQGKLCHQRPKVPAIHDLFESAGKV
jgi:hypothetical protein